MESTPRKPVSGADVESSVTDSLARVSPGVLIPHNMVNARLILGA